MLCAYRLNHNKYNGVELVIPCPRVRISTSVLPVVICTTTTYHGTVFINIYVYFCFVVVCFNTALLSPGERLLHAPGVCTRRIGTVILLAGRYCSTHVRTRYFNFSIYRHTRKYNLCARSGYVITYKNGNDVYHG